MILNEPGTIVVRIRFGLYQTFGGHDAGSTRVYFGIENHDLVPIRPVRVPGPCGRCPEFCCARHFYETLPPINGYRTADDNFFLASRKPNTKAASEPIGTNQGHATDMYLIA